MLDSPGVDVHRGLPVSIGNGEVLVPVLRSVALAVSPVVGHGHAGDWGRAAVVVRLAVLQYVSRVARSGFYRLPPSWLLWAAQGRDRVDLSKGRRRWRWRTEVTSRGDRRRPRCSGPPHLGWGGAPSGSSPLLRPTRCSSCALFCSSGSGAASGAGTPTPSPIVSTDLATRPHRAAPLPSVRRPPGHPVAARTHAAAEFDLGRGASWRLPERGSRSPEREAGEPPAARLREDDPALPPGLPSASHLPYKLTRGTELSGSMLTSNQHFSKIALLFGIGFLKCLPRR